MASGTGGFRWSGARAACRGWVAVALLVAVLVLGGCDDDDEPDERVTFLADGTVVADSVSVEAALRDASERVGYPVIRPEVPAGWEITVIRTEIGPAGPDQDGNIRDLGRVKLATLVLRGSDGRFLELGQLPPEKPIRLPAGAEPRPVDAGVAGVTASVVQSPGKTTLVWDSEAASYSASYAYPDESYAADAEAFLVGLLGLMK